MYTLCIYNLTIIHHRYNNAFSIDSLHPHRLHIQIQPNRARSLTRVELEYIVCAMKSRHHRIHKNLIVTI